MAFNISYCAMLISLLPFTIFVLSGINIKVTPVSPILNEIRSSLNDYPLSDFEYTSYCGNKYSNTIYTFPGNVKGCTCVGINHYYYEQSGKHEIHRGKCTTNQTYNGCEDISEISHYDLKYWDQGRFCSKYYNVSQLTYKGYLHFLNSSVLKNEECQKGYKKCGLLDDFGNYLCLPEEEDCPINDIKVRKNRDEELEKKNYNYTNNNERYFYYTNTSNKPVILKMKATEGKICMDRAYYHTDYPQYILDKNFEFYGCRHKIEGKLYEDNLEILDSRKKGDIYLDSNLDLYDGHFYYYWYYDYPFYSLEANMNLYAQRYIGYDKKCLMENGAFDIDKSPFNETKISEIDKKINKTVFNNKVIIWFAAISFIIELLASALLDGEDDNPTFIWVWTIINLVFYIPMAVPLFLNLNHIKLFKELPLCGGNIINIKIDFYNSTQSKLKITTILGVIFVNCQILFNIILIILKFVFPNLDFSGFGNREAFFDKSSKTIDYNTTPEEKKKEDPYYENPPEQPFYAQQNNNAAVDYQQNNNAAVDYQQNYNAPVDYQQNYNAPVDYQQNYNAPVDYQQNYNTYGVDYSKPQSNYSNY